MIWWMHSINNFDESVFANPNQFIPERWIENKNEIPKFANRQFSHGPRMCVGKRFADLELQIAIHKIISNFKIEWMRSESTHWGQLALSLSISEQKQTPPQIN